MALSFVRIADNATTGPLVGGIGADEAAYLAATNPSTLVPYFNAQLIASLQSLPEGTRMELDIGGFDIFGYGFASTAADRVNAAWQAGQLNYGGEPIQPWPEYPSQVAWGDDATGTITFRALKAQWQAIFFIALGAALVIAFVVLWNHWSQPSTPWQAQAAYPPGQQPTITGQGILAWLARNWPWLLLAGGALAAAPFVVRKVAELREAENKLTEAERGVF